MGAAPARHATISGAVAGVPRSLIISAIIGALMGLPVLAACGPTASDDPSGSPTPPPTVECTPGSADRPTAISRLTLDGVTADSFATTLTVPFNGLQGGPLDRPSVVRAAVVTAESGAPVTFRTNRGTVIGDLAADWLSADREITVLSAPSDLGCSAAVYLLGTQIGQLTLTVQSQGSLTTTVDVVTASAAARTIDVDLTATEVTSGEDIDVSVRVADAFGNPVPGSAIVVSVPRESPARYPNGSNRATVLTGDDGRADVRLLTDTARTRTFAVRVRGVDPRCGDVNQYACATDQPFPGAGEAIAEVRERVTVVGLPPEDGLSLRSARR